MDCRNVALLPSFNRIMEDRFSESFPVGSPGKLDASASCEPVEDTPLRQALRATEESLRYLRQAQLELALPSSHLPSQKAVSFDTHSWRSNKQCQVSSELRSDTSFPQPVVNKTPAILRESGNKPFPTIREHHDGRSFSTGTSNMLSLTSRVPRAGTTLPHTLSAQLSGSIQQPTQHVMSDDRSHVEASSLGAHTTAWSRRTLSGAELAALQRRGRWSWWDKQKTLYR